MAKKHTQTSFKDKNIKPKLKFGGQLLGNNTNPKTARPISTKHSMHVVLRSNVAKGPFCLKKKTKKIHNILNAQAEKNHIRIYEKAVVGNHIHLLIYLKSNSHSYAKKCLTGFLRAISGLIAREVVGAQRGNSQGIKFWAYRPFSRVVIGFKKGFEIARSYVFQNQLEADGVIAYQPRKNRYAKLMPLRAGPN